MSNILFKSDIADTLDYNRADMALSARQGRALKQMLSSIKKEMMLEAHPVGSLYWSMEATDPSKLFGGTWEQIKDRFVWAGTGYSGSTGGSFTQTLTTENLPNHKHSYLKLTEIKGNAITQNQMPAHSHTVNVLGSAYTSGSGTDSRAQVPFNNGGTLNSAFINSTGGSATHTHAFTASSYDTGSTGKGSAFSILPPFIVAYCWRRTA